jgi:DNA-binding transcriptional regulator YiaG
VKSNLTKKNYRAKRRSVISASRTRRTEKTLEIFARLENQSGTTSKWEMSATEITGDDIKAWRARKALTQAMAARRLGLAKATLQDWERGRRTPGITRGVGPEQFRRVVRTIFHT